MSTAPSSSSRARSGITLAGFLVWILFCLAGISIYHCYTYIYNLSFVPFSLFISFSLLEKIISCFWRRTHF